MRVSHEYTAMFDDPNLVSCADLAPVLTLAEKAGLGDLIDEHVSMPGSVGANARLKVLALVAGMVAGVDTIDGMGLLRHGGMRRLFNGIRAASTLGTCLRAFSFGHVRQLDAVASRLLIAVARRTPLLAGAVASRARNDPYRPPSARLSSVPSQQLIRNTFTFEALIRT